MKSPIVLWLLVTLGGMGTTALIQQPTTVDGAIRVIRPLGQSGTPIEQTTTRGPTPGESASANATQTRGAASAMNRIELVEPTPGQALVGVDGWRFVLRVTQCQVGGKQGQFKLHAQQSLGQNGGELWITGGRTHLQSKLILATDKPRRSWQSKYAQFDFDGQQLSWHGNVTAVDGGSYLLAVRLRCRPAVNAAPNNAVDNKQSNGKR